MSSFYAFSLIASNDSEIYLNQLDRNIQAYKIVYPELDEGCQLLGNNPSFDYFIQKKFENISKERSVSNLYPRDAIEVDVSKYITRSMQESLIHMMMSGVQFDADKSIINNPIYVYILNHYDKFMDPYHDICLSSSLKKWAKKKKKPCAGLLHDAVRANRPNFVEILLSYGVNPNDRRGIADNDDTPLAIAVRCKSLAMVAMLLKAKANPNVIFNKEYELIHKDRLLHFAVHNNLIEITQLLIDAGSDINSQGHFKRTALSIAAKVNCFEIIKMLLAAGADTNVGDESLYFPVHKAAENNRLDIMTLLLQAGANPNVQSCVYKKTPLTIAMEQNHKDIIDVLLDCNDINLNHVQVNGYGPIHYAVFQYTATNLLQKMLSLGADPNILTDHDETPFTIALYRSDTMPHAEILLKHGANLNLKNRNGRTPLHHAVEGGRLQAVKLLLQHNAGIFLENNENQDVFYIIKSKLDAAMSERDYDRYSEIKKILEIAYYSNIINLAYAHRAQRLQCQIAL